jgi:cell division protease FtsH
MQNDTQKRMIIILVMFMVFLVVSKSCSNTTETAVTSEMTYTEFLSEISSGGIESVVINENGGQPIITATTSGDTKRKLRITGTRQDPGLVGDLMRHNVKTAYVKYEPPSGLETFLISWAPFLLLIGVWVWFMNRSQGGGGGGRNNPFSFGKSRAKLTKDSENIVTFKDIAGCDEAKEEVQEMVDFLRDPTRYQKLGGKMPKGALFVGSPGTGKTLLAKAIAGEARVPFFSISGSDFVEMFVGVGASRVRDMFETARKNAPCIIFIDEIDAVGRSRGAGLGGGNDEREQTLNQLLVEMDGFDTELGVIVIAATNRPDVLDAALLRPGRFDRQVVVPLPDIRGREQILHVHMRKVPIGADVDKSVIARGTPGFSGADLANLVNEAALFAARRKALVVEMSDFENAKDKIMMGAARKAMVMSEAERRNTAYHESGHVLVGKLLPKCDPVHKVTIIPRGRSLGVTMMLPEQDRYGYDKEFMLSQISMLFGGRIAEEVFMNQMTTGASNDFERATQLARDMVMKYGMSEVLGPMVYAENEGEVFLGKSITKTTNISEATMQLVDAEVRRIIDVQYKIARNLIEANRDKMETMAAALLEWETLDAEQIDDIMAGKVPRPPVFPAKDSPKEPGPEISTAAPEVPPTDVSKRTT